MYAEPSTNHFLKDWQISSSLYKKRLTDKQKIWNLVRKKMSKQIIFVCLVVLLFLVPSGEAFLYSRQRSLYSIG